jgi:hypothetical protein
LEVLGAGRRCFTMILLEWSGAAIFALEAAGNLAKRRQTVKFAALSESQVFQV